MRNHRFALVLAGSLALGHTGGLGAQDALVPIGTRVRLSAPSVLATPVITGTVRGLNGDVLTLKLDNSHTVLQLSMASVERFEVSHGKNRGRGALIGLGVGAGLGAIIGYAAGEDHCGNSFSDLFCLERPDAALLLGTGFGMWGAIFGTLFAGDRWGEVAVDRVRVGVGPGHGSLLALSASISF